MAADRMYAKSGRITIGSTPRTATDGVITIVIPGHRRISESIQSSCRYAGHGTEGISGLWDPELLADRTYKFLDLRWLKPYLLRERNTTPGLHAGRVHPLDRLSQKTKNSHKPRVTRLPFESR